MIRFSKLPCWVRLVLAFVASAWVGAIALPAGAEEAAGAAAEAVEVRKPLDREFVTGVVGPPAEAPLTGQALEEKTHAVALLLRCPVCQGSSVADSPSATAVNMKQEVRDLVALGYGRDQVLRYFEASYGQFVLMEPKAEGLNLLVWIGPGLLLVLGGAAVALSVRRLKAGRPAAMVAERVPGRGELPEDPELARYVRKVREIAYGWRHGEPPNGVTE